jgi:hypothetical protein
MNANAFSKKTPPMSGKEDQIDQECERNTGRRIDGPSYRTALNRHGLNPPKMLRQPGGTDRRQAARVRPPGNASASRLRALPPSRSIRWRRCACHRWPLEPHTSATSIAGRILADQLDAGGIEGANDLHQGIDYAAHVALARFHALHGRERHTCKVG